MIISTPKLSNHIPMLTAADQTMPGGGYIYMGIDTEMLFRAGNKYIWPHLEGFKQEREKAGDVYDWHGDGYAFELCTPPTTCLEWMAKNIGYGLYSIQSLLPNHSVSTEVLSLEAPAVYKVPATVRKSATDDVKRLGCAPSLNVYGDAGTPSKLGDAVRTTGCHLHATHKSLESEDVAIAFVQWADVIVGNVWNYVSPEPPQMEALRRTAYGRAGEYRARLYPATPTTYEQRGVEYRVLPGSVIRNPVYLTLCFNLYRTALRFAKEEGTPSNELLDLSRKAINTADKEISAEIVNWLPFPEPAAKLLHILSRKPLPTLSPMEWYQKSRDHHTEGHRHLAVKEGLVAYQD